MKIVPCFLDHWKTEILIDRLGADGVVAVLRLWFSAQIQRRYSGLELSAKRLAMATKWKGDADELFAVLTDPDAPWLDLEPDGKWTIHGFAEHQHQVVKLWANGQKGGRPKTKEDIPTSPSTSPSTSPICKPNENHMVSKRSNQDAIAEAIYQAYPKKVAPDAARKAIKKALKKIDGETLLKRTREYAAAIVWKERQFIPNPATWFNRESFNDDPAEWDSPIVPTHNRANGKTILSDAELAAALGGRCSPQVGERPEDGKKSPPLPRP